MTERIDHDMPRRSLDCDDVMVRQRVRAGLSESDRYWLSLLRDAPMPVQIRISIAANAALDRLVYQGVLDAYTGAQHDDARCALVATLFRFYAARGAISE
jgi:hypothetical protein